MSDELHVEVDRLCEAARFTAGKAQVIQDRPTTPSVVPGCEIHTGVMEEHGVVVDQSELDR